MTKLTEEVAAAARLLAEDNTALTLLHTYYDDARQQGLLPHHSINRALGKLGTWPKKTPGKVGD